MFHPAITKELIRISCPEARDMPRRRAIQTVMMRGSYQRGPA
jgi:hypothetical protein